MRVWSLPHSKMLAMGTDRNRRLEKVRQLTLPGLAVAAALSLALASSLSGCTNVAGYTQPTLVRAIDASYVAPAVNVLVEGNIIAGNVGQGIISPYGTLPASTAAPIKIANASTGDSLTTTSNPLLAGHQYSVFLTDLSGTPSGYTVSVLTDQQISAPTGHSSFRFLNQAIKTGPVDVYMIPAGSTLALSIPIAANLPVGASNNYIDFTSQTVTLVVTPAGKVTPLYTSPAIYLSGGEVRTVLLIDAQLTSNPPVQAFIANDVN
jgi:Domain of unknown function (DUF4397)